jgi:catechol 2,3-dioxygenase-like lactoylglutathione lyase family enzyme
MPFAESDHAALSRRQLLRSLGLAAPLAASAFGQGRCRDGYATRQCPLTQEVATAPIQPLFAATGWKTVALDHISFLVPDYRKEAAFYAALLGWKLRSDDGKQAVLDIGDWGSAILKHAPEQTAARVDGFSFVIEPWNAQTVKAELQKRGMIPVADNDAKGFESFHVKDPDGFDLQVCNGAGLARARKTPATAKLEAALPFDATGWKCVWLDHFSYNAANYKASASFYCNLLGWKETYDEGSQHELMMGDVGDIIVRGGNPNDPNFGNTRPGNRPRIDHISFGIAPWDTDGVKAELEKHGLKVQVDTSTRDDIHVAAYKSYHVDTPCGFNVQMSYLTHDTRLGLANAVKPKPAGGR